MPVQMTREQKQMALRLRAKGVKLKEITRELNFSLNAIEITLRGAQVRSGRPDEWVSSPGRLTPEEREDIFVGLSRGESMSSIARSLGRSPSTVTRDVKANGGASNYGPWRAHCRAREETRRPKVAKLCHAPLVAQVTEWLEELWSPQEIAARLRLEFPGDASMQVSHETIYQSLFVQGRGEAAPRVGPVLALGSLTEKVPGARRTTRPDREHGDDLGSSRGS